MLHDPRTPNGATWLANNRVPTSSFGRRVADLLDLVYAGIYHIDGVESADWTKPDYVVVPIAGALETFDHNKLTTLVFLCHTLCIRCAIRPRSYRRLELLFSARARTGNGFERHPDLAEAVAAFEAQFGSLTEVQHVEAN